MRGVVVVVVVFMSIYLGAAIASQAPQKAPMVKTPSKPVTTPNPPDSTPSSTQPSSDVPCTQYTSCDTCPSNDRWDCVWCEGSKTCINGNILGPSSTCSGGDWRYKQCWGKGLWVELGIGGGTLVLLVLVFSLIAWRCCCRRRPQERSIQKGSQDTRRLLDDVDPLSEDVEKPEGPSLHPKNDQKRLELSEKYGIDFSAQQRVRSFNGMKVDETK